MAPPASTLALPLLLFGAALIYAVASVYARSGSKLLAGLMGLAVLIACGVALRLIL